MRPFWLDLFANTLATLIGVAIGVPIALWIARRQEESQERQRKHKIVSLLIGELRYNFEEVDKWLGSPTRHAETAILRGSLKDELWHSFSDGGELQWIRDLAIMDTLATSYHRLAAIKYLSEKQFDSTEFRPAYTSSDAADALLAQVRDAAASFTNYLREVIPSLESSLARKD